MRTGTGLATRQVDMSLDRQTPFAWPIADVQTKLLMVKS
jgi:hypothetical protein